MIGLFSSDHGLAIREIRDAPWMWPGGLVRPGYVRVAWDPVLRLAFYDAYDADRFAPILDLTRAFREARRK